MKAENERIKDMASQLKGKQKREYIWDYYKLHIIGGIIGLIIIGSLLNMYVFNPPAEIAFDITMMVPNMDAEVKDAYVETLNALILDPDANETVEIEYVGSSVSSDANVVMAIQTKMMAKAQLQALDVVVMDDRYYSLLSDEGGLTDLEPLLSGDLKERLGDALLGDAIMVDDMPNVQALLGYKPADAEFGSIYIGIMDNSLRKDKAVRVLEFLTEK